MLAGMNVGLQDVAGLGRAFKPCHLVLLPIVKAMLHECVRVIGYPEPK